MRTIPQNLSGTVKVYMERNILDKFFKQVNKPLMEAIKQRDKLTEDDFLLIASICGDEGKRMGNKIVDKKINPRDHTNIDLGLKYDLEA